MLMSIYFHNLTYLQVKKGYSTRGSVNLILPIRECEMWSDGLKSGICDVRLKGKFFRIRVITF